jgi:C_GCAxxG_C_C family probable redox protein
MNRREFCMLGVGSAATAGVIGLGKLALGERKGPARIACDADALAAEAVRVFLPCGRSCGEAVLAAGCKALAIDDKLAPDVALGLAGGVGLQGDVCGVLSGSALVIGLAAARQHSEYARKRKVTMAVVGKLYRDFEKRFGSVECRMLCGLDLTTPEGMAAMKATVKKKVCAKLVDAGARMLAACLQQVPKTA